MTNDNNDDNSNDCIATNHYLELSMLPDDILVHIGTHVAKLCGLQDFVFLSQTCKRFQKLLVDSQETVKQVIRIRTSTAAAAAAATAAATTKARKAAPFLPSYSLRPISLCSLEELALYERVQKYNFLRENRLCEHPNLHQENRVHFEYSDLEIAGSHHTSHHDNDHSIHRNHSDHHCMELIRAVRSILEKHPTASVVLDSHCGTPVPSKIAWMYSHVRGQVVYEAIVSGQNPVVADRRIRQGFPPSAPSSSSLSSSSCSSSCSSSSLSPTSTPPLSPNKPETKDSSSSSMPELHNRIRIRAWGKMVSSIVSQSQHPYRATAQKGRGWIEISFRMETNKKGRHPLVLPPRPYYYHPVADKYKNRR